MKRLPKNLKLNDPIYMEWIDAVGAAGWGQLEDLGHLEIVKTCAFYRGFHDGFIFICGDISPKGSFGNRAAYPLVTITKIRKLK